MQMASLVLDARSWHQGWGCELAVRSSWWSLPRLRSNLLGGRESSCDTPDTLEASEYIKWIGVMVYLYRFRWVAVLSEELSLRS
jgi:hypothetical protein